MIVPKLNITLNRNWSLVSFLLLLSIHLFIFRTAIPSLKYPFLLVFPFSFFLFLSLLNKKRLKKMQSFFLVFFVPLIVTAFFLLGVLLTNKFYSITIKELANTLVLFLHFFFLFTIIDSKGQLLIIKKHIINICYYLTLIILINNIFGTPLNLNLNLVKGVNLDPNFALIPYFFSFIIVLNKITLNRGILHTIFYNTLLVFFSFFIITSGSRRGILLLITFYLFFVFVSFLSIGFKHPFIKKIINGSRSFIIIVLITSLTFYAFIFHIPYSLKNNILDYIGVANKHKVKEEFAHKIHNYVYPYNANISYKDVFNNLWSHTYTPLDPGSGWGTRIYKPAYPLIGPNSEIIPKGCIGYLLDSSSNSNSWGGNAYSYTRFANIELESKAVIKLDVFCFVSENFNGKWVKLSVEGSALNDRQDFYDLNNKGKWQKLSISPQCEIGKVSGFLYFSKYNTSNFDSLNGFVIFAHPTYDIISIDHDNIPINIRIPAISIIQNIGFLKSNPILSINRCNSINQLSLNPFCIKATNKSDDPDPVRRLFNNYFIEDSVYNSLRTETKLIIESNLKRNNRIDRWRFARAIFTYEYNLTNKLFGGGFYYLNWYGYYFYKDKTRSDWPHNPFLSVLLYSGIIGFLVYFYFIYKVFYYYIRYRKQYGIFFIFYLITFFFSFFSANGPFNPPVMGFFVLLPFFIHYFHKKEADKTKNEIAKNSND